MDEKIKLNIDQTKQYFVLPLASPPLFPEAFTSLIVGESNDAKNMRSVIDHDNGLFVALTIDSATNNFTKVGTLCRVTKSLNLQDKNLHLFVATLYRVKVLSLNEMPDGSFRAYVDEIKDEPYDENELKPLVKLTVELVEELSQNPRVFNFTTEVNIANIQDPALLSFYVAAGLQTTNRAFLQELIAETNVKVRLEKLIAYLSAEEEVLNKQNSIKEALFNQIRNRNKQLVLQEQIRALTQELNKISGSEDPGQAQAQQGRRQATKSPFDNNKIASLPDNYKEVVKREIEKLNSLDPMNPDYTVTKLYIDNILALPFAAKDDNTYVPNYTIEEVRDQLEKDHYGMKEVKERILEFLASRLKAKINKGAIICLAGPPGVGKTSVGHSIAKALKKEFYRFSVGGMRDEAEIKGHRRTYVGAMPGKIIAGMKKTGVVDPVFLIDEIDKMGISMQGDPASALLEVLDPEQNSTFQDHYIDLPYDLSKVLFIVTANDISKIPEPLLDRMEIIELGGYTPGEKYHIGSKYLVPKLMKKNGLKKDEVRFSKTALEMIAEEYAREAGVRNFENLIDKIMRKVSLEILDNSKEAVLPVNITQKNVSKYLGKPHFPADEKIKADKSGTAIGLAWTSMGGDVLLIEAEALPFKGDLKVTGQLGDVMKESVSIAWSTLKRTAYERGLDLSFFDEFTVHLHIPEGAVPKDGPSAGITLFTALWSMLRDTTMKKDLAMTGELSLTGKVLPIGGLKEKVLAARRNGIKEIIIPKRNEIDLEKLTDEVKGDVIFHPVSDIEEVINIAFPNEKSHKLTKQEMKEIKSALQEKAIKARDEENIARAKAFEKVFRW